MNESLAARQEALTRQNQELDKQLEAIELRRQQVTNGSQPSFSSTSLRRTRSASPRVQQPAHITNSPRTVTKQNDPISGRTIEVSVSIDSLSSQAPKEACRKFGKSKDDAVTRQQSARGSKHQSQSEATADDAPRSQKPSACGGNNLNDAGPMRDCEPKGLSLEATARYQKARLRVLQDEAEAAIARNQQLQEAQAALKGEMDSVKADNMALKKKNQQTQQLFEKQRELSVAQEANGRILKAQLASTQARVEESLRTEKLASQQVHSRDVRLNRALEEIEKLKAQLQDEKKNRSEQMVHKSEYDQVVHDNQKLDKQKGELLLAFKKQMKLVDLLKRQRVHMEAAKMLSFTEAEFSKTLDLG